MCVFHVDLMVSECSRRVATTAGATDVNNRALISAAAC